MQSVATHVFFATKKQQFFPPGCKEPITTAPPFSLGGQKHPKKKHQGGGEFSDGDFEPFMGKDNFEDL